MVNEVELSDDGVEALVGVVAVAPVEATGAVMLRDYPAQSPEA